MAKQEAVDLEDGSTGAATDFIQQTGEGTTHGASDTADGFKQPSVCDGNPRRREGWGREGGDGGEGGQKNH